MVKVRFTRRERRLTSYSPANSEGVVGMWSWHIGFWVCGCRGEQGGASLSRAENRGFPVGILDLTLGVVHYRSRECAECSVSEMVTFLIRVFITGSGLILSKNRCFCCTMAGNWRKVWPCACTRACFFWKSRGCAYTRVPLGIFGCVCAYTNAAFFSRRRVCASSFLGI